ncbi:MAG: GntR family transcriptional regulator, partial [Candidatus Gastranaerophilales bacterium]|nr:GntR family transcriptional regulator [Candidatus Gastranaerophilales bacterium]
MAKISISHAKKIEPKFSSSKEEGALSFLIEFRSMLLREGLAKIGDIIPSKKEIAHYLNISTGTVQNAVKYAEDMGLFTSKQCIGTMISDGKDKSLKMVSKKDKALYEIKKYLIDHKYEKNEIIPGYGMLADELRTSQNTIRLAVFELIHDGILKKEIHKKNTLLILNLAFNEIELSQGEEIKN